ncbi:MAG: D-2-hydroxyacid dehydrogenase [Isosphaeraceae bacterium]
MKIVVLDGRTLAPERESWVRLERFGELVVHDHSPPELVRERAAGATILLTNKTPIRADLIRKLPDLRFISVLATGFDCVDLAAARQRGIPVSNVPEYGTDSVAQYVFALLLELCHHVVLHAEAVRAGEWTRQPDFSLRRTALVELAGKTMGIVGHGRIGRRTGELARAFGMKVIVHDLSPPSPYDGDVERCELDDLFARSDAITLHCPLTEQTAGLVNRDRLALMKPTAFLINTARGPLVVEPDLAEALNAGRLAGAAVDVVAKEPIQLDNPLLSARNCLVTPHIAWATSEARGRLMQTTVTNVEAFLAGRPIHVVN